jgi:riboflavin kinase/FMN adenylyltransferase
MKPSVLTIGTFDGVHRGHQALLRKVSGRARRRNAVSAALTFERPPRLFFSPSAEPSLLTTPSEKKRAMESYGIGRVVFFPFVPSFMKMSPEVFFERVLVRRFRSAEIFVGYDFRFGRGREGTAETLKALGRARGVAVTVVGPVRSGGHPVSSGRIRNLLKDGALTQANRLLGRPYSASGRVVRGRGLGRKLGFPTANLALPADKIVPLGVFAVRAGIEGKKGKKFGGVCNVGFRPTVDGRRPARPLTEVHLFGCSDDLYGRTLTVEFVRKLRGEKSFPSVERLKAQIRRDALRARSVLRSGKVR